MSASTEAQVSVLHRGRNLDQEHAGRGGGSVKDRQAGGACKLTDIRVELGLVEIRDKLREHLEGAVHWTLVHEVDAGGDEVGSGRDGTVGSAEVR